MSQSTSFQRGTSLVNDFKRLINDERFFDITLKCSDEKKLNACKAILATRSDVFSALIFTKSGSENELLFKNINSNAMKVILEYLYTSKVEEKNLTISNVVEVYYASIQFKLNVLQQNIIERTKKFLKDGSNVSKNLLSQFVKKFTSRVDNEMSQILINWVSKNRLESFENDENDPLSLEGLKYLLMRTLDTKIPFATTEFDIWKYALKKVINTATNNKKTELSNCSADEIEKVKMHLTPFTIYIDLKRMDAKEIFNHVEPINIFSIEKIKNIYRSKASDDELPNIRGIPVFKWKYRLFEKQLIVSNDESTIEMKPNYSKQKSVHKSILGDMIFKNLGKYEWNIVIEKLGGIVYIGVCGDECLSTTEQNYHGWVLGSDGYVYRKNEWKWYDAKMKVWDKVTIHLEISTVDKRRKCECSFSINGIKKPVVSGYGWDDIPSQVYPVVSLGCGSKLRIEPVSSV